MLGDVYSNHDIIFQPVNDLNEFTSGLSLVTVNDLEVELVSKELNHLAAILHVYARGLIFLK